MSCDGSTDWCDDHGGGGRDRRRDGYPGRAGRIGIAGGFLSDHGFGDTLDGIMNVVGLVLVAVGVLGLATGLGSGVGATGPG